MAASKTTTPPPIAIFFQSFMTPSPSAIPDQGQQRFFLGSQAVSPEIALADSYPRLRRVTSPHSGIRSSWQESSNLNGVPGFRGIHSGNPQDSGNPKSSPVPRRQDFMNLKL